MWCSSFFALCSLLVFVAQVNGQNTYLNITFGNSKCNTRYPGLTTDSPKYCLTEDIYVKAGYQGFVYIDLSNIDTSNYQASLAVYPTQFQASVTMFGSFGARLTLYDTGDAGWNISANSPMDDYHSWTCSSTGGASLGCLSYTSKASGVKTCKPSHHVLLVIGYTPDIGVTSGLSTTLYFGVGDDAPVYSARGCPSWVASHAYAVYVPVIVAVVLLVALCVVCVRRRRHHYHNVNDHHHHNHHHHDHHHHHHHHDHHHDGHH